MHLRPELIESAGPLQTCAGMPGGTEAAIHAMREIFNNDDTEAMILVDAENAFNSLNRKAALLNINAICPEIAKYLVNTYRSPSKLFVNGTNGSYIMSEEGTTQGDNAAMNFYACSTKPLIAHLGNVDVYRHRGVEKVQQVWYADDSSAAGKLESLFEWWTELNNWGPLLGYYPAPEKCHIIVKNEVDLAKARHIFSGTNIQITIHGRPFLGSAIGSSNFVKDYVTSKVSEWVTEVENLSKIAETEPQCAYYAYITSVSKRWLYLMRTLDGIATLFEPIEKALTDVFIPSLLGKNITPIERNLFALPVRYGGMGIHNPVEIADLEYLSSTRITAPIKDNIITQAPDFRNIDQDLIKITKNAVKATKKTLHEDKLKDILACESIPTPLKRSIDLASEKGASVWLVTPPNKEHGFVLNKQEFRDAMSLRYSWPINGVPKICICGKANDIDHALTCKRGGYVSMRHNSLRNTEAALLQEVCHDVTIEPSLIPINGEEFAASTSTEDQARLDISARGVWSPMERVFLDVRVTHPNTPTNRPKSLRQIYKEQEREKKRKYNERVIEVEKASFVPLVFTTSGGMSPECEKFNKRLAELIATKRNESYADVISYIRKKLRFSLLKATLVALRGYRGKKPPSGSINISEVEFNLVY